MDKSLIRKAALAKRDSMGHGQRALLSSRIAVNALSMEEVRAAKSVAAFLALGSEVDTRELIEKLFLLGKEVSVPVVEKDSAQGEGSIKFARLQSLEDELIRGWHGVLEPAQKSFVDPKNIGLFFVPGIAFGTKGARLGWGKGHYDRFFNENKPKGLRVGLCFSLQMGPGLPVEKHDVLMDAVVTEKGALRF